MEIKQLQEEIKELVERINNNHGYDQPEIISYMKVVEEVGEITDMMIKTQIDSRKGEKMSKEEVKEEIGKEISDAVIALISLANDFNIDLNEFLEKKMSVHNDRHKSI
jgi:NTP pyrophosphatase (non-canonical NTP hydrolase)